MASENYCGALRQVIDSKWWPETGSNRRRRPFQGRALPLSYLASENPRALLSHELCLSLQRQAEARPGQQLRTSNKRQYSNRLAPRKLRPAHSI
jgi:hypothetical protein